MARMTPPAPPLWRPGWFAEKHLFEALQAGLGEDWHVFHDYAYVGRERPVGVIPFALGRAVHDRLTGSRLREWYEVPSGGHNDCFEADAGFFPRIGAFLGRALPLRSPGV